MTHKDAVALLSEIHRKKDYRPTEWERRFLQDLSFDIDVIKIPITAKQSKVLQEIYRKSQEE